jgi:hypothetical protein
MSQGVESQQGQASDDAGLARVSRTYGNLMRRTESIDDPLARGAVQLAVILPTLGYLVTKETIEDIGYVRTRNN